MIGIYKWGWGDGSVNLAFWGWSEVYSDSEPGAFVPIIVRGAPGHGPVVSRWASGVVTYSAIAGLSADGFKAKASRPSVSAEAVVSDKRTKSVKWTAVYACDQAVSGPRSAVKGNIPGKLEVKIDGAKASGREDKAKVVKR